jgi:hypothetical protein
MPHALTSFLHLLMPSYNRYLQLSEVMQQLVLHSQMVRGGASGTKLTGAVAVSDPLLLTLQFLLEE